MAYGVPENGFGGITEHLTTLTEKKYVLPRQLAVAGGGTALIVLFLILGVSFPGLFPLFFLLTAGAAFLTWFMWRYAQVEYEYLIAEGEMTFSAVYGKKSRRDLFSFPVKEAEKILPYGEEKESCDAFPADETRFYAARFDDEDTLCALITRADGKKVRLFFQGTPAAVTALRRVNPAAVKGLRRKPAPAPEENPDSEEGV